MSALLFCVAWAASTRPLDDPAIAEALAGVGWAEAERVLQRTVVAELDGQEARDGWELVEALERSVAEGPRAWRAREERYLAALAALDAQGASYEWGRLDELGAPGREGRSHRGLLMLWSALAFTPILVGLAGVAAGRRFAQRGRRQRRRGARRLANPYVTGRPLRSEELVFGRDALLDELVERVRGRRSGLLQGERRIGKTTLLLQLQTRLERGGAVALFVDLAGTSGDEAARAVQRALMSAARRLSLEAAGARAAAEALAARGDLVLLIDELDALQLADEDARAELRELMLVPGAPATALAAGVAPDFESDEEARRWGELLPRIPVGPLDSEHCRSLLTGPVAGKLSWSEGALVAVLERAEGRPMRVQLYGLHVTDRANLRRRGKVTVSDVSAVDAEVDRAWRAILDHGLGNELALVDLDAARLMLGRLGREIADLEDRLERSG